MKRFYLLLWVLLITEYCCAQFNHILPEITNFTKQEYKAGNQNWNIKQSANGLIFIANNEGLLYYDGISWGKYNLPNSTWLRAIAISDDKKIYAGGQDELGYFEAGKNGRLIFHDLTKLIPQKDRSFEDIWSIIIVADKVFFRSTKKIFLLHNNHISVYNGGNWRFMGLFKGKLLAQDLDNGLKLFENGIWQPFYIPNFNGSTHITGIFDIGEDSSIITTLKEGIFLNSHQNTYQVNISPTTAWSKELINMSCKIDEHHFAIATRLNGIYIVNKRFEIKAHYSRNDGLQNNNVINILPDNNGNLWLGLDNGVSFIGYNSAISFLIPDNLDNGAGYTSLIHEEHLYLGTSNALYYTPINFKAGQLQFQNIFKQIEGTRGQVWNLTSINDIVLMAHHEGAFEIKNNAAKQIDNKTGYWGFLAYDNVFPTSLMIAGNYKGLQLFNYENAHFIAAKWSNNFESSRFLILENEHIWVSQPYKGIFRIGVPANNASIVKPYLLPDTSQKKNANYIFKVKNKILACNQNDIFEYDPQKDQFIFSEYFNKIIKEKDIRYIKEDQYGNVWVVYDKNLMYLRFTDKIDAQKIYLPEFTNKMINGFEHIYVHDNQHIFIGSERGFYILNIEKYISQKKVVQSDIRLVRITAEKEVNIYEGHRQINLKNDINYHPISDGWKSIYIEYSAPSFGSQLSVEYAYLLKGFEKEWSSWSKKNNKEYTNLPPGNYSFFVKSRDNLGNVSEETAYHFKILPAWYQHPLAYLLYIVLIFIAIFFIRKRQKIKIKNQLKKLREQQEKKAYLQQLELDKSEKEIISLKNEKLEFDIEYKNAELASLTMHLLQKAELMETLKDELIKLNKNNPAGISNEDLKKTLKTITEDNRIDNEWDNFAKHFDKVHSQFLTILKSKHPQLTNNDLKLCAYLRMNLSSKEIAQLMNITTKGVELSRYRLRKKLGVEKEETLLDFFVQLERL